MSSWAQTITIVLSIAILNFQIYFSIRNEIKDLRLEIKEDMNMLRTELREEIRTHTHSL